MGKAKKTAPAKEKTTHGAYPLRAGDKAQFHVNIFVDGLLAAGLNARVLKYLGRLAGVGSLNFRAVKCRSLQTSQSGASFDRGDVSVAQDLNHGSGWVVYSFREDLWIVFPEPVGVFDVIA